MQYRKGYSPADILVEESSHTTYENLVFAREVAVARGLKRVLIVSDPLHMKRAVTMALDLGLDAYPSPTPTTRYQGGAKQLGLLAHETYYYIGYLFRRSFIRQPPLQPRSKYALLIGALLPGNWELSESNNEILLVRKEQIKTHGCIGLDVSISEMLIFSKSSSTSMEMMRTTRLDCDLLLKWVMRNM